MDVYLSLINGVINQKKHTKWDNGALQVREDTQLTIATGLGLLTTVGSCVCSAVTANYARQPCFVVAAQSSAPLAA